MSPEDKIVDAAAEMFLSEGIKSVRMDDIATRLGVSKRTLYEIFADKQALIERSLTHLLHKKHERMLEHSKGASNVIEEIFLAIDRMRQQERDAVMVVSLKKYYPEIYKRIEALARKISHDAFDGLLRRGIEQGLFLPDMDRELALMTIHFTMSALVDKQIHPTGLQYVVVNFFRGLATQRGVGMIDELVEKHKKRI